MNIDDRFSLNDIIRGDIESVLMNLYTCIPAIVKSYNSSKQSIECSVAVKTPTYSGNNIKPVTLKEVPLIFPASSNWVIAGPVVKGDAVLLLVPHFGIEEYLEGNKNQEADPLTVRRHDLNEAVAIPGMFTRKNTTVNSSHNGKFHISQGNNVITMDDSGGVTINTGTSEILIDEGTGITITGNVIINGNLSVSGTTTTSTGTVAKVLDTHTHAYTDDGNPLVTGPPV